MGIRRRGGLAAAQEGRMFLRQAGIQSVAVTRKAPIFAFAIGSTVSTPPRGMVLLSDDQQFSSSLTCSSANSSAEVST